MKKEREHITFLGYNFCQRMQKNKNQDDSKTLKSFAENKKNKNKNTIKSTEIPLQFSQRKKN